jgi:hypothetical protein
MKSKQASKQASKQTHKQTKAFLAMILAAPQIS